MRKNMFICELSQDLQAKLYEKLKNEFLLENEDLENAMDSRICDLEELISFNEIQELENEVK